MLITIQESDIVEGWITASFISLLRYILFSFHEYHERIQISWIIDEIYVIGFVRIVIVIIIIECFTLRFFWDTVFLKMLKFIIFNKQTYSTLSQLRNIFKSLNWHNSPSSLFVNL